MWLDERRRRQAQFSIPVAGTMKSKGFPKREYLPLGREPIKLRKGENDMGELLFTIFYGGIILLSGIMTAVFIRKVYK